MTQKSDGLIESPKNEIATTATIDECEYDLQKGGDEEDHVEEPHFVPVLPIMSDLSMPSLSSGKGGDGEGFSDDASIKVLTTDDIYTIPAVIAPPLQYGIQLYIIFHTVWTNRPLMFPESQSIRHSVTTIQSNYCCRRKAFLPHRRYHQSLINPLSFRINRPG